MFFKKSICKLKLFCYNYICYRGSSSVVEHHLAMVGVAGSNPVFRSKISSPTGEFFYCREMAQFGRALRSGRRGRKFKSCFPDV